MPNNKTKNLDNYSLCYQKAINLLARREHSRLELSNKLRTKPYAKNIDLALLCDHLETSGYLSNERFAEMFVYSRILAGKGELKIRYELRQRGISDSLADATLLEAEVNWLNLAKEQREKRFGKTIPKDFKERARQSRFLNNRGFSGQIIRLVFV